MEYTDTWNQETTTTVKPHSWYVYRRQFGRGLESITVSGCPSPEDARLKAEDMARTSGWTNPKWYEWWRWGDRKVFQSAPQPVNRVMK